MLCYFMLFHFPFWNFPRRVFTCLKFSVRVLRFFLYLQKYLLRWHFFTSIFGDLFGNCSMIALRRWSYHCKISDHSQDLALANFSVLILFCLNSSNLALECPLFWVSLCRYVLTGLFWVPSNFFAWSQHVLLVPGQLKW